MYSIPNEEKLTGKRKLRADIRANEENRGREALFSLKVRDPSALEFLRIVDMLLDEHDAVESGRGVPHRHVRAEELIQQYGK